MFALPDLYPLSLGDNEPNRHRSFEELSQLLRRRFNDHADLVSLPESVRDHFCVHCLKYDLEVLLLAASEQLAKRLKTTDRLRDGWRRPVEDQNNSRPPKQVVKELFRKYKKNCEYDEELDAEWILARADLETLERECGQRFAPFTRQLRGIAEVTDRST